MDDSIGRKEPVKESQSNTPAPRGTETTEKVGEEHISETEGQVSCKGGRREISNTEITGVSEEDGDGAGESKDGADPGRNSSIGVKPRYSTNATLDGETKAEADGEGTEEGWDKASATTFSGPGM